MVDLGQLYCGRYLYIDTLFQSSCLYACELSLTTLYFCQKFTLACIKMGRPELARRAVAVAEEKLSADKWPEYYDTRSGRFVGKQSRSYQTWTIAGFLTSKILLENPELASILTCDEDLELLEGCACCLSQRTRCSRRATKSDVIG